VVPESTNFFISQTTSSEGIVRMESGKEERERETG